MKKRAFTPLDMLEIRTNLKTRHCLTVAVHPNSRQYLTGFTLTELLVTMSVISLLMAILVPVLSHARAECRKIECMSNLRQLSVAAQAYATENDDYYPSAYISDPNPNNSVSIYVYWDFSDITNWNTGAEQIKAGLLWRGQTVDKVQQCPSFKGSANSSDPYTGYNYNTSFIGHGSNEVIVTPAKRSQVKRPEQCALFGDGEYTGGANKFMRSPLKSNYDKFQFRTAGTQGYRHCGATNVAWCDGHASSQKELYTNTDEGDGENKLDAFNKTAAVKVGFLSPDNSAYDLD